MKSRTSTRRSSFGCQREYHPRPACRQRLQRRRLREVSELAERLISRLRSGPGENFHAAAERAKQVLFPEWSDELFPLYVYHPSRQYVPARLRVFTEFLAALLKSEKV